MVIAEVTIVVFKFLTAARMRPLTSLVVPEGVQVSGWRLTMLLTVDAVETSEKRKAN